MTIPDEERAKRKLSQIGYYRLSGFWYPCRKVKIDAAGECIMDVKGKHPLRGDDFQEGTNFDSIIDLYLFDKKLRMLMMDALERIEIHVRSVIAHEVGRFDPLAYLNTSFVNPAKVIKGHWKDWSVKQEGLIGESREDCIRWHKMNKSPIPFWVVVETWNFGQMSKYFENLKGDYQNTICERLQVFDASGKPHTRALKNWLQELNTLRNKCAHHARIWNREANNAITISGNSYFKGFNLDEVARKRIYSQICILWFLLQKIGPHSDWIKDVADLVDAKPDVEFLPCTAMGFPDKCGFPRDKFNLCPL